MVDSTCTSQQDDVQIFVRPRVNLCVFGLLGQDNDSNHLSLCWRLKNDNDDDEQKLKYLDKVCFKCCPHIASRDLLLTYK